MRDVSSAPTITQTKPPRIVLIVGIIALFIVGFAFIKAIAESRTVPFSRQVWEKGRNLISEENPRLRMKDQVIGELNGKGNMRRSDVEAMLGAPDKPIGIQSTTGLAVTAGMSGGGWNGTAYVLGVLPKSTFRQRRISFLTVSYDTHNRVSYAYTDEIDFPKGSIVVPAPPPPMPAKPKVVKAPKRPAKKSP